MNSVRGFLRIFIRIVVDILYRFIFHIPDSLFGFLNWPTKKLYIKILILQTDEQSNTITPEDIDKAIIYARNVFRKKINVRLLPFDNKRSFVEVLKTQVPGEVLHTKGGGGALIEEFKTAGSFFAVNLVSPIYPITVFVVKNIKGAIGCSLGPLTDYVTLDHDGAKDKSVLAHELAHACGLWHVKDKTNLLWHTSSRGDAITWWQKNIFRSSRHVTFW